MYIEIPKGADADGLCMRVRCELEAKNRMRHTSRFSLAPRSVISKGGGMRLLVELTLLLIALFPLLVIPSFSLFLLLPPT
jgi:hypothetical protein